MPADSYLDRCRSPEETVALMRPHFGSLGITRVALQTGLDRIGIPVYAAFRPNARTLAVNTGKGIDAAAAKASAVMEATEYAVAEQPDTPTVWASHSEFVCAGRGVADTSHLLPADCTLPSESLGWILGRDLLSGEDVFAPRDALVIDHTGVDKSGFSRSTNGLASGNTEEEATFHALCELVERDAETLFSFRSLDRLQNSAVCPSVLGDPLIDDLARRIADAGLALRLFDMTTDIGLPVYKAVIWDGSFEPRRQFDVSAGSGCHPVGARAAARAITEAAQTRITTITGARDDFEPERYSAPFQNRHRAYLSATAGPTHGIGIGVGLPIGTPLTTALDYAITRIRAVGIISLSRFVLGGSAYGISVVKLLCGQLEDRPANRNWRPRQRAVGAIMVAA